jgi:hypothetical protein
VNVKTYRPDDPEFARHVAASARRVTEESRPTLRPNFDPRFGAYIAGRLDNPPEKTMAEVKRATKDEIVKLPDGRQIQIQAKGAPVVDENLAERERQLAERAKESAEVDHLAEIQPEEGTHALSTGTVPTTRSRPLSVETPKGK